MFGLLKSKDAAPKRKPSPKPAAEAKAAPKTPRTAELDRKFADRPANANVTAMVHLYVGSRLLELLVRRRIVNFGEGVSKSDEATALVKANLSFINELTSAHAEKATDFEEFKVRIQERALETTLKLAALLRAADQRVGSPESELAEGLPWPAKTQIAIALDGVATLFGVPNPEAEASARMRADATPMAEEEIQKAFLDDLLDAIARGNKSKAYAFIRMAGFSLAQLAASPDGRSAIGDRVAKSVADHGALDSSLMRFDDVPDDIETEIENADALFTKETISLERRAAAYAGVGNALTAWVEAILAPNADVVAALAAAGLDADGADVDAKAAAQLAQLKAQIAEAAAPIVAADGKVESVAMLAPLRAALATVSAGLMAMANGEEVILKLAPGPGGIPVVRQFAEMIAAVLATAAEKGEVEFDDSDIDHSEHRPGGFDTAIANVTLPDMSDSDKLKSDLAMAEAMLVYFSHHAAAAAKG